MEWVVQGKQKGNNMVRQMSAWKDTQFMPDSRESQGQSTSGWLGQSAWVMADEETA